MVAYEQNFSVFAFLNFMLAVSTRRFRFVRNYVSEIRTSN